MENMMPANEPSTTAADAKPAASGDGWAYAQADHFTDLAGLYGEGAVLVQGFAAVARPGD